MTPDPYRPARGLGVDQDLPGRRLRRREHHHRRRPQRPQQATARLRIKEIRAFDNPICLFGLTGWLDFFFGVFVEVDLFIKTFRYDVELFRLKPPIKLFEIKCEPQQPVLAAAEATATCA